MTNRRLLGLALCVASSFSIHAAPINKQHSELLVQNVKMNISKNSVLLSLTEEQYKFAIDQFMRLQSDSARLKQIMDIPEFISPANYTETELTQVMNQQKLSIANYLAIPVELVDKFIQETSEKLGKDFTDYVNDRLHEKKKPTDTEIITIRCKDACATASVNGVAVSLSGLISIYGAAVNAGIRQYQEFAVNFEDDNGKLISQEVWKYNNYSGAWRERVISKPCPTCSYN